MKTVRIKYGCGLTIPDGPNSFGNSKPYFEIEAELDPLDTNIEDCQRALRKQVMEFLADTKAKLGK